MIVAGHSTAGVTGTLVADNLLTYNGTMKSKEGAGVIIATEVRGGTVADNIVTGNTIYGNGLAGVTIHAHLPGQNLNGNRITDNRIGVNNTLGDPVDLVARSPRRRSRWCRTPGRPASWSARRARSGCRSAATTSTATTSGSSSRASATWCTRRCTGNRYNHVALRVERVMG